MKRGSGCTFRLEVEWNGVIALHGIGVVPILWKPAWASELTTTRSKIGFGALVSSTGTLKQGTVGDRQRVGDGFINVAEVNMGADALLRPKTVRRIALLAKVF